MSLLPAVGPSGCASFDDIEAEAVDIMKEIFEYAEQETSSNGAT